MAYIVGLLAESRLIKDRNSSRAGSCHLRKRPSTRSVCHARAFPLFVPEETPSTIASSIRLLLQHLIHRNTPLAQIRLGQFDLFEKFLMRFGLVLESVDTVAEFAQEVCAKGDEGPEGKL